MLQIWSLTPAKWQKAVKKFPHDPATPLTSFDVVSEAGVECVALSAKELQTVNSIRPWISLAMDSRANVRPQDADLHSLRQTPAGHIFPTTRAKQWQPYVNMKYFDKNPVTASVREVPTPDLDKYPVLAMMYRHPGWLSRTFPSGKLHAATMYACLCVVEQRLAIATTGRLMLLDCGRSLFHSFTKFLSSIAKPAHTKRRKNVPWAASPEDNVRTWIPWDDALRESFQQQAAAQFPPPDMSLSGDERIHAVKRMRRYRAELADLRKRLEGSLCAQSAPHGTGFVQYHVACAFDRLVMVSAHSLMVWKPLTFGHASQALMGNIHRIEARMRGLPVEAPYVFIDVPPLQPFYVEYRAGPSVSEPTVFMDSDEIHERNPHLFDQYITLAFAEGWPLLDGQDDTWPLPQQLKGWPTVLGTTREETVRAALHEYELASKKTLLSAHKSRTFADPPPGPVRAFDDETFTLLHPKVEPFKEEDVKDCAQVRKLLGLPADADLDRNAAKGDQDVNMTELSGSKVRSLLCSGPCNDAREVRTHTCLAGQRQAASKGQLIDPASYYLCGLIDNASRRTMTLACTTRNRSRTTPLRLQLARANKSTHCLLLPRVRQPTKTDLHQSAPTTLRLSTTGPARRLIVKAQQSHPPPVAPCSSRPIPHPAPSSRRSCPTGRQRLSKSP